MFNNQIYRQIEGAAMGSSLSPVVANLFMIYFERKALKDARLKPKLWLRYVDDIFVVWPFGKDELLSFLDYLNSIHPRIQFTVELEEENKLPFLDVLVSKTTNGSLEHTIYRKPTHTNRYLNAESHHHPTQLQGVVKTLISRSVRLSDDRNRPREMEKITTALKQNGYKHQAISNALRQTQNPKTKNITEERPITIIPYVKGTTDKIGRLLRKHNIKTVYKPHQTIRSYLKNPKDKIKFENQGVYCIPCGTCNQKYVGQTNRRISARLEEHKLGIRNKQTTSALFIHQHETGHTIDFENSKQIASIDQYKTRLIRESIEIEKCGELNKRDDAINLPSAWKYIFKKETVLTPPRQSPQEEPSETNPTDSIEAGAEPTPTNQRYYLRPRPPIKRNAEPRNP